MKRRRHGSSAGRAAHRRELARRAEAVGSLDRFRGVPEQVAELYGERARAIREAFNAGAGVSEIADRLGIPRSVVYRAVNGNGGTA